MEASTTARPAWMPSKSALVIGAAALLVALVATVAAVNKIAPVSSGLWGPINETDGVAMQGYDPVAYFGGVAQAGTADLSHAWGGVAWHFASEANRQAFQQDPATYAPQYGGFCATAVSSGVTAVIEPEAWHIEAGRLYLFNGEGPKQDWLADLDQGVVSRGDANWQKR